MTLEGIRSVEFTNLLMLNNLPFNFNTQCIPTLVVCVFDMICVLSYENIKCLLVLTYNYKLRVKIPANMVCSHTETAILDLCKLVNYAIGRTVFQKLTWLFKTLTNRAGSNYTKLYQLQLH